jgi:hypothetical protein
MPAMAQDQSTEDGVGEVDGRLSWRLATNRVQQRTSDA